MNHRYDEPREGNVESVLESFDLERETGRIRDLRFTQDWLRRRQAGRSPRFEDAGGSIRFVGDEAVARAKLSKIFATDDDALALRLTADIALAIDGIDNPESMNEAIARVQALAPRDGLEAILAAQIAASHALAMRFTARAMGEPDATQSTAYASTAAKSGRACAALIDALERHRSRGQQRITVEHVTVESGGQAVVGNVQVLQTPGGG